MTGGWIAAVAGRSAAAALILLALVPGIALAQTPTITGRVLAAETGAALPRARIAFTTADPLAETVLSDDEGRFVLPRPSSTIGVPISISASKAGYATAAETLAPGRSPATGTIRLTRGASINGLITLTTGEPAVSVLVSLRPETAGLTLLDDGAFRVTGVSGPRRFVLMGGPEGVYLKSASVNGSDAVDQPFDFGTEGKPFIDIEIIVGTDGATLRGRVANDRGEPVPDYSVLAFAVDATLWYRNAQRVKLGRPNQEGSYRIMGLPPGDYFVAAVVGLEGNATSGEWQNPRFLESLAKRAQRITLGPSETRTLAPRVVQP